MVFKASLKETNIMGPSYLLIIAMALTLHFPSSHLHLQLKSTHWRWHSAHYKKSRDYQSLKILIKRLKVGMPRSKVEEILGEPDYSPVEGVYYYASNRENSEGVTIGLLLEYRKTQYRDGVIQTVITGKLESFRLMLLRE